MKGWRIAAWAAALAAAAGAGAALGPVVLAQGKTDRPAARAFQFMAGGSHIGVSIRDIDEAGTKGEKGATAGVVIEEVRAGSPAEKAGMRKGDVIVEFDGERVRSVRQLTRLVQETPAGRTVQSVILRDGQRTTVPVTPEEGRGLRFGELNELDDLAREFRFTMPPRPPAPPTPPEPPGAWSFDGFLDRGTGRLGITLSPLSPQLAEYFGAKGGVLVSSVAAGSAASAAGLRAGDVITAVNGTTVDGPADVRRQVQALRDGGEFSIDVLRNKQPQTLKGKIDAGERRPRSTVVL